MSCWDKLAETAAKSFKEGDLVYVAGQVSLHTYMPQGTTDKRTVLRLNATDARLLASSTGEESKSESGYKEE